MRKLILLTASIALVLSLAACAAPAESTMPAPTLSEQTSSAPTPAPTPAAMPAVLTEGQKIYFAWLNSVNRGDIYACLMANRAYEDGELDEMISGGLIKQDDIEMLIGMGENLNGFFEVSLDDIFNQTEFEKLSDEEIYIKMLKGLPLAIPEEYSPFEVFGEQQQEMFRNGDSALSAFSPETGVKIEEMLRLYGKIGKEESFIEFDDKLHSDYLDPVAKWYVVNYLFAFDTVNKYYDEPVVVYNGQQMGFFDYNNEVNLFRSVEAEAEAYINGMYSGNSDAAEAETDIAETEPAIAKTVTAPATEDIQAFCDDAHQVIYNTISEALPNMENSLKNDLLIDQGIFAAGVPLMADFEYVSCSQSVDASGVVTNSSDVACYDFTLNGARDSFYEDSILDDVLGDELGLNFEGDSDNFLQVMHKRAQGSGTSYSAASLYYGSGFLKPNTLKLTFNFPGRNQVFDTLVDNSFKRLSVSPLLNPYAQTNGVYYARNAHAEKPDTLFGIAGKTWRGVSAADAQQLMQALLGDGMSVVYTGERFSEYYMSFDDACFEGLSVKVMRQSGGADNGIYIIQYNIYYKNAAQRFKQPAIAFR